MRRNFRILLLSFILLSLAVLSGLVFVNHKFKGSFGVKFTRDKGVQIKIDEVRYSGTREGRRVWELEAQSATRYSNEDRTVFDSVKLVFYSQEGLPYTLRAKQGVYSEGSGVISVSGDVTVVSENEFRLETETLTYSTRSEEITSDDPIELFSPRMNVQGTGLLIEVDRGRFLILKDVRTVLKDALI